MAVGFRRDFEINKVQVESIVSNICDLYASKEVESDPKNLGQYGLDNPVTVTLNFRTVRLRK